MENGKKEAGEHSQVYCNGEVGIDEVHNLTLLRIPVTELHLKYTTTGCLIQ